MVVTRDAYTLGVCIHLQPTYRPLQCGGFNHPSIFVYGYQQWVDGAI